MPMSEIMVSVICLTYNHKKYIKKTLDSIIEQKTNFIYEILVHDDASNDGTTDIIKSYMEKYPNLIHLFLQAENQFSKKNYRASYDLVYPNARGKYIAVCEGDDYWIDKCKLQKQFNFLESHLQYGFVAHPAFKIDKQGLPLNEILGPVDLFDRDITLSKDAVIHYPTASMFYRRELKTKVPYWYYKNGEAGDYVSQLVLLEKAPGYYMHDIMSVYRTMTPGSSNERMQNMSKEEKIKYYKERMEILKIVDKETGYIHSKEFRLFYMDFERAIILCEKKFIRRIKLCFKYMRNYKNVVLKIKLRFVIPCIIPNTYHLIAVKQKKRLMNSIIKKYIKCDLCEG